MSLKNQIRHCASAPKNQHPLRIGFHIRCWFWGLKKKRPIRTEHHLFHQTTPIFPKISRCNPNSPQSPNPSYKLQSLKTRTRISNLKKKKTLLYQNRTESIRPKSHFLHIPQCNPNRAYTNVKNPKQEVDSISPKSNPRIQQNPRNFKTLKP